MADKEILQVEIDDSEFSEFKKKFDAYEAAVKEMPKHWQAAGSEITAQKTQFEKTLKSVEDQSRSAAGALVTQEKFNGIIDAAGLAWVGLHKSGKLFAGHIVHATQHLMRWTKLTAVFSGILGAGGLFGINRMAASVAGQRTSATGLGISYGEQASFLTNFGRLGNAEGILQGFAQAETDVSKKYALRQYLGHAESGDPAKDFAEGLNRFKEFVDKTPQELLGPMLQARGYDKLGIGTEQARIIRGMSVAEVGQLGRGYQGDVAGRLGLSDVDAKKWTEFSNQMERAGREIETVFAKGTVKLAKPLEHLSESFIHLVESLLKDGNPISGWIKDLGRGIRNFADDLGSGAVQAKAVEVGKNIADTIKLFDAILAKAPNGLAVLAGMAVGARFGGAAVAAGGALARSGVVGTLGAGAAAAGALGATVYPQPLNEGEDERARQQRFHQGPFAPKNIKQRHVFGHPSRHQEHVEDSATAPVPPHRHGPAATGNRHPMPVGVFPKMVPSKPKTLSDKSSIFLGGNPNSHIHHPRRYQGKMKIGNESFDYASGSFRRGRGSSPYGDHPITGFDPSAMHGRGGGAFRTTDVFDPQTGDKRGAVEIHMSNQEDIRRVETAGCFGIPRSEWQGAKSSLKKYMEEHGGATLRVYPNGNSEVVPRRSPQASYAPVRRSRQSFGHPHVGHHPATVGRKQESMTIEDHTGGMVHIASGESGSGRNYTNVPEPMGTWYNPIPRGTPNRLGPDPDRSLPPYGGNRGTA